jgi:hypothetical protein
VLLRDPILRAHSIYDFERNVVRRETSDAPHTKIANERDFAGWVEWCLELPIAAAPISNYQTRVLSLTNNGRYQEDWEHPAGIVQYREAIAQLGAALVGTVESIGPSLLRIERALEQVFPGLHFLGYVENASRTENEVTPRSHETIEVELGHDLYARLCEANAWDLLLHAQVSALCVPSICL